MRILLALVLTLFLAQTVQARDYAIVAGDKLAVSVYGEQDLSLSVTVRPDGKITYPHAGEVQAAGLTPIQLAETLAEQIKVAVRKPMVTVTVVEGQNDKIYVVGGGVKPTVYEIAKYKTLLQVLASIEDMSQADLEQASLVRDNVVVLKGFRELYEEGDVTRNQEIRSGDVILLPVLKDRYVYVSGAVNKPKTLPYHEGMTVLDAIMEAEGFTKFANKNDTKVVRRNGGKEEVLKVKAKRLLENGDSTQNIVLRRGDMVIVEEGIF